MSMQSHLQDIGLVQYAQDCGFETWRDLVCITESDLEQIGMLRGHRRKLQRVLNLFSVKENGPLLVTSTSEQQYQKRRYRRHPKRDSNAPARPKTAYQLFAREVRRQMQDDNMTFVELAKLVGARWAILSPDERNTFLSASKAKLRFQDQLRLYTGTEEHLRYQQYLQGFKNQHDSSGQAQQSSEARNSHMNEQPSEPTRDDAILGSQTTPLQRQQGQTTGGATDGHTLVGSGERTLAKVDRYEEMKSSSPVSCLFQANCANPNHAVPIEGHGENQIRDCASTSTTRLDNSQYFRTVLHT
ncbi:uncharacterized protein LY89DRAFT_739818 [Mollisia scopiformis]|uniref:HMG box domain-containing protein n=1 Tax=Mollisia scopiformis TaxID=149040 RepID=A0A194WT90_MOLSC|nr:uncharacterized protein LY89DRAFT_739818 [Mollisia scopiformis]KUJ10832.1 hypothetical protein LY89DRAFT_739818 [Mollisia scopiformis]